MMQRGASWIAIGAILGALGVAAGAFGAHGLRDRLDPDLLDIFKTGAHYQMIHALALVGVGLAHGTLTSPSSQVWLRRAGALFLAGTIIFSGSLYALSLSGVRILGAITPLGGVGFIGGWVALALAATRRGS